MGIECEREVSNDVERRTRTGGESEPGLSLLVSLDGWTAVIGEGGGSKV